MKQTQLHKAMKLSIVIVNYNVKYYLSQCLLSVQRAINRLDAEVFVVDNHSSDGSVDYLRRHFPWVHVIASTHNNGFARANNMAIRQSHSEYVLLLNPDTIVGESSLKKCVEFMDSHPDAGSVGVRMTNDNGVDARESRRGKPSPLVAFYKMAGLCSRFPNSHRFGKYYMGYLSWDEPGMIEVVSGAFCMLRREALDKVGLLDEDFFMYGEDIDLSCRVMNGGYSNWYLPVRILHYKGESTQKSSFRYVHVFYDAMLIFFRKHYGHLSTLLAIPIKMAIYVKATFELVKMLIGRMKKSLGFFSPNANPTTKYIVIGHKKAFPCCSQLLEGQELKVELIEGDAQTLPDGHNSATVKEIINNATAQQVMIVYDIEAYTYEQILEAFASNPLPNVRVATFHSALNMIITPTEIYTTDNQ